MRMLRVIFKAVKTAIILRVSGWF